MKGTGDITVLMAAAFVAVCAEPVLAAKDQTRLPEMEDPGSAGGGLGAAPFVPSPGNEPLLQIPESDDSNSGNTGDKDTGDDNTMDMTPAISTAETIELTPDLAKRAIDGFVKLKNSYQDTDIAEYESLEQFVAEAKEGPALEKDIKSFGFKTVGEWNTAITSVSFAYAALSGTHEDEIKQELENIKNEVDLDEQMKKSLIEGLQSMLPSDNNKKIVADLNNDKNWAEKLKLLEETAEEVEH
ncbi:MAG: hypothetical protein AAFW74_09160 [Pseudomonadota bacterium]